MTDAAAVYRSSGLESDQDRRVVDYLPLVAHVIGRLTVPLPPHVDRDDLMSAGVLGLMHASKTWDPAKGASFKSHAFTRIRGAALDELRRADPIGKLQREKIRTLNATHSRLASELGGQPTLEQLGVALNTTPEEVDEILTLAHRTSTLSLDASAPSSLGASLADLVGTPRSDDPAVQADLGERKRALAEAMPALDPREREVLGLYYHDGLLLREIGEVLGVSESRVCQIHTRALYKLRGELERVGVRTE